MELNVMTNVSHTGYGVAGRNFIRRLNEIGCKVSLFPHGRPICDSDQEREMVDEMVERAASFNPMAPCLNIWHQHELAKRVGHGTYTAFSFFELDTFRDIEKHHLTIPHKMIVASKWAKEIIHKEVRTDNVYVVPLGVNTSVFRPNPQIKKDTDDYIFFNIGKWEKRKGHDILVRAFDKAFEKSDKVKLMMMPHNSFLNQSQLDYWVNMYSQSKLASKITILPPEKLHSNIASHMQRWDCGVFPARAEGWNLELLEAMACGKPVIATNYSATTEYTNKDNTYLIEVEDVEPAYDGKWFFGHGNWASFDIEQEDALIEHMRYCYKNKPENPQGLSTAAKFTWEKATDELVNVLFNHQTFGGRHGHLPTC